MVLIFSARNQGFEETQRQRKINRQRQTILIISGRNQGFEERQRQSKIDR